MSIGLKLSVNAFCMLSLAVSAAAGDAPLQGVQVSDMDRTADPCDDFFEYANGKWRAENPIPPSMSRWKTSI